MLPCVRSRLAMWDESIAEGAVIDRRLSPLLIEFSVIKLIVLLERGWNERGHRFVGMAPIMSVKLTGNEASRRTGKLPQEGQRLPSFGRVPVALSAVLNSPCFGVKLHWSLNSAGLARGLLRNSSEMLMGIR